MRSRQWVIVLGLTHHHHHQQQQRIGAITSLLCYDLSVWLLFNQLLMGWCCIIGTDAAISSVDDRNDVSNHSTGRLPTARSELIDIVCCISETTKHCDSILQYSDVLLTVKWPCSRSTQKHVIVGMLYRWTSSWLSVVTILYNVKCFLSSDVYIKSTSSESRFPKSRRNLTFKGHPKTVIGNNVILQVVCDVQLVFHCSSDRVSCIISRVLTVKYINFHTVPFSTLQLRTTSDHYRPVSWRFPSAFTFRKQSSSLRTTLPAQHVRNRTFCCRPDGLQLTHWRHAHAGYRE